MGIMLVDKGGPEGLDGLPEAAEVDSSLVIIIRVVIIIIFCEIIFVLQVLGVARCLCGWFLGVLSGRDWGAWTGGGWTRSGFLFLLRLCLCSCRLGLAQAEPLLQVDLIALFGWALDQFLFWLAECCWLDDCLVVVVKRDEVVDGWIRGGHGLFCGPSFFSCGLVGFRFNMLGRE